MTIGQSLLPEFDQEMMLTRRLIERVPSEKVQWKPHPKSFALGHLTQLVAWIPGWIGQTLRNPALNLAGGAAYTFETTENMAGSLAQMVVYDLPADFYATYTDRVRAITPADAQRVAERYLQPDKFAVVVVGDLKVIEPGIKALNLGPITTATIDEVLK